MIKLLREGDDTFKGDSDRPIWDDVVVQHRQQYSGKILLPARTMTRIEIAAKIIERDPELCRAFTGGLPEVSIFWTDRATGVPMKVRMDYWKPKVVVDYKSFENSKLLPIDMAVAQVVAAYRYQFQMAFYLRAVVEARRLIAQGQVFGEVDRDLLVQLARPQPMTWMWVFQMKGAAPVARGKRLPLNSFVAGSARDTVNDAMHKFVFCWRKHGATRPWVDGVPVVDFNDTDFPAYIND